MKFSTSVLIFNAECTYVSSGCVVAGCLSYELVVLDKDSLLDNAHFHGEIFLETTFYIFGKTSLKRILCLLGEIISW